MLTRSAIIAAIIKRHCPEEWWLMQEEARRLDFEHLQAEYRRVMDQTFERRKQRGN